MDVEVQLKEVNYRISRLEAEENTLQAFFGDVDYSRNAVEKDMLWKMKMDLLDKKERLLHQLSGEIDTRKQQIDTIVVSLEHSNDRWIASHGISNSDIMKLINDLMDERDLLVAITQKVEKKGGFYGNVI
jgi:hypothetical protein